MRFLIHVLALALAVAAPGALLAAAAVAEAQAAATHDASAAAKGAIVYGRYCVSTPVARPTLLRFLRSVVPRLRLVVRSVQPETQG